MPLSARVLDFMTCEEKQAAQIRISNRICISAKFSFNLIGAESGAVIMLAYSE